MDPRVDICRRSIDIDVTITSPDKHQRALIIFLLTQSSTVSRARWDEIVSRMFKQRLFRCAPSDRLQIFHISFSSLFGWRCEELVEAFWNLLANFHSTATYFSSPHCVHQVRLIAPEKWVLASRLPPDKVTMCEKSQQSMGLDGDLWFEIRGGWMIDIAQIKQHRHKSIASC